MSFRSEIVADSINSHGNRITTFLLTMPRIVLAEFNTHRMLTRNSASSRAIPVIKMIEVVQKNPFTPMRWMKEHTGMQGTQFFSDDDTYLDDFNREFKFPALGYQNHHEYFSTQWLEDRDYAIKKAKWFVQQKVSKQVINRLLEPFMWHTVLSTATEWENFFDLRANEGAEIHIQHLAYMVLEVMNASQPKKLEAGEWHIPFGDQIDEEELDSYMDEMSNSEVQQLSMIYDGTRHLDFTKAAIGLKIKIATARAAQTSYTVVGEEGKPMNYPKLISLHDRLAASGHWSPFEHCAKAMSEMEYVQNTRSRYMGPETSESEMGWCGNFRGFVQYRKLFANENRKDSRLIKKEVSI